MQIVSIILLSILVIILLILLLWNQRKRLDLMKEKQELIAKQIEFSTRLNILESKNIHFQLNPHLFKNILNTVQSSAYQTYFALEKLSHVLDYILYESSNKYVKMKDEINFALHLIDINRIKLSPLFELNVKNKISTNESILNQEIIAPLITIDLIENAFKHTDLQNENAFINIVFEYVDAEFKLTVSNSLAHAPTISKEKSGIGMLDLEKRLAIIYGKYAELDIIQEKNTYTAKLKIDLNGFQNEVLSLG